MVRRPNVSEILTVPVLFMRLETQGIDVPFTLQWSVLMCVVDHGKASYGKCSTHTNRFCAQRPKIQHSMRASSTITDARIWTFEFIWGHLIGNPVPDWGLHGDRWSMSSKCTRMTLEIEAVLSWDRGGKVRLIIPRFSSDILKERAKIANVDHIHDNLFPFVWSWCILLRSCPSGWPRVAQSDGSDSILRFILVHLVDTSHHIDSALQMDSNKCGGHRWQWSGGWGHGIWPWWLHFRILPPTVKFPTWQTSTGHTSPWKWCSLFLHY